ncbi:unnamed protein product, partial [Iphiclides podalirius]
MGANNKFNYQKMKRVFAAVLVAVFATGVHSAPQLISFTDGKLGVNFGGYHAAVGIGGLLGNGANGGLFAEAGTPHGQSAKAGLGGAVDANGGTSGGLYAGATAGGNVRAAAGLAGGTNGGTSAGTGYASAQAGNHFSSTSLIGKVDGSTKKGTYQNIPFDLKTEDTNELNPQLGNSFDLKLQKSSEKTNINQINTNTENQKTLDVEESVNVKEFNHFQKTSFTGGSTIDNGHIGHDSKTDAQSNIKSVDQISYKKDVTVGRNPHFFEDIFNIPIAALTALLYIQIPINTLGAVNKFLENNVPLRKRVSLETGQEQLIRPAGPHARRRAIRKGIIEQNSDNLKSKT